jgi:hypothetical protein
MRRALVAASLVVGLLSACAPQVPSLIRGEERAPAGFPEQYYQDAILRQRPVFRVDPARSIVAIEVRRGGSLAQLGHDHVVASHDVRGYVAPEERRADVYVPLDRLVVDEPGLRAEAGFRTEPSATDVAATRQNMLEKVLEVERYPFALISVGADNGGAGFNVSITLHGVTRSHPIEAKVEVTTDALGVSGQLALDQTEFGIVPFAILGGAIQVENKVNLRFDIRARRTLP